MFKPQLGLFILSSLLAINLFDLQSVYASAGDCGKATYRFSTLPDSVTEFCSYVTDILKGIPQCSSLDHSKFTVGSKCKTSKNKTFTLASKDNGESWKDPDGLIWHEDLNKPAVVSFTDEEIEKASKPNAGTFLVNKFIKEIHSFCSTTFNDGSVAPTKHDIEKAESYGFREVFPNMAKHDVKSEDYLHKTTYDARNYWSVTPDEEKGDAHENAVYLHNGETGELESGYVTSDSNFVNCVKKQ